MNFDAQAREARRWWRELIPDAVTGQRGDRAVLARLRRAATPLAAAEEAATIDLARRLGGGLRTLDDVAVCAAVLAHVRRDDGGPVARRVGPDPRDLNRRPLVSALRFRRLIQADSPEDKLVQFRRLLALADHTADVADLARALLDWSEWRRREWIFRYYAGEPPARDDDAPAPQPVSEGAAP